MEMSIHTLCAIITSNTKLQDEAEELEELFAGWAKKPAWTLVELFKVVAFTYAAPNT